MSPFLEDVMWGLRHGSDIADAAEMALISEKVRAQCVVLPLYDDVMDISAEDLPFGMSLVS